MISQQFAVLGAALPLAGFGSYIWDMTRGRAEPNRVSWALWAAAPLIAFPAELAQHTRLQAALVTLALGTGPLAVLLISLTRPQCYWTLTRFGYACAGLSAAALALWLITRRGDTAIALAIAADGFAAVPTVGKSWSHPRSESPWTYLASGAGSAITLLTIRDWTFAACGFPAYVGLVCVVISGLILVPRPAARVRAVTATAIRRGGWAAGIAGSAAALAVAGLQITGSLTAPVIPAAPAPPAAAAVIGARPTDTTAASRQPCGPQHHRHRHAAMSSPGSPAPLTTTQPPPSPSPTRPPRPCPRSPRPSATGPYPSTTSPQRPPTRTPAPSPTPSPPPSPSPDPAPATPSPSTTYGG